MRTIDPRLLRGGPHLHCLSYCRRPSRRPRGVPGLNGLALGRAKLPADRSHASAFPRNRIACNSTILLSVFPDILLAFPSGITTEAFWAIPPGVFQQLRRDTPLPGTPLGPPFPRANSIRAGHCQTMALRAILQCCWVDFCPDCRMSFRRCSNNYGQPGGPEGRPGVPAGVAIAKQ